MITLNWIDDNFHNKEYFYDLEGAERRMKFLTDMGYICLID